MVSSLIEQGAFSASTAGYIAAAEVFGVAISNAATTFTGARLSWRMLCGLGLMLMLVGTGLSVASDAAGLLMGARAVSGLGSGLLISRAYAAAGLTRNPDRMLGYILATSTAQIALASYFLPGLAAAHGLVVIFVYFGALTLIGFPLLRWMPVGADAAVQVLHGASTAAQRVIALTSAAFLFLGLGVLFAYLFQLGLNMGATTEQAAVGLTLSQIAAFVGALIAAFGVRWIPAIALHLGSLVITMVSIALFQFMSGGLAYAVLASGFNGASNTTMVLALGVVASLDVDGRWLAAAVTSQIVGFALGPALAAMVVSDDNYILAQYLSIAFLCISAVGTIVVSVLAHTKPRIATASAI